MNLICQACATVEALIPKWPQEFYYLSVAQNDKNGGV